MSGGKGFMKECAISCSSDNDFTAFADILYGVGQGIIFEPVA